jgi:hypothetical protein
LQGLEMQDLARNGLAISCKIYARFMRDLLQESQHVLARPHSN